FTTPRSGHSVVAYNGYMYILGGGSYTTANVFYNDVQYAQINPDGTLGTWQTTASFTTARQDAPAMAHNGYMYILGGKVSGGMSNAVQYAPINADGTLGTWQATTSFTTARQDFPAVTYNGYLYVIGGDANTATLKADVQYAKINADGTVGTWAVTTSMIVGRQEFAATVHNGYLYVMGGEIDGNVVTSDVQFVPIHANGTLGWWDTAAPIAGARQDHTAIAYNGFIYSAGGKTSAGPLTAAVEYAPLKSIARIARYSKVIDLGSPMSVSGVAYNGSVPGGAAAITYRAAGINGVFGTQDNPLNISTLTTCTTSVPAARYVLLSIVLDDIATGVYADVDGTKAYLSDISINYLRGHPDPDIRLKLGKTLQENEGLSPLDTCFNAT
ncbi:MAG: hypothetical protein JWP13_264, partial [Candidatus Saccharibacteria bacterium]|nr:hypothetical protein [Candidatus Saccharibacteria bacterium]